MTLTLEQRKARDRALGTLRGINRSQRRAAKAKRPKSLKARAEDHDYLSWLHEDIPCVACVVEGPTTGYPIEAAHQKHCGGKGGLLGKRPPDADSCPLCAWHHRIAPNACDPPQRKFWARLGIDVGAFCGALYAAFLADASGAEVVRRFAQKRPAASEEFR